MIDPAGAPWPQPDELASVQIREEGDIVLARIAGEIDISNVGELARTLTSVPNRALGLILDLRATRYFDSAAVSMLHDLASRLAERSQRLVLVCSEHSIPWRVLTLTGVNRRAAVHADLPAAFAEIRGLAGRT